MRLTDNELSIMEVLWDTPDALTGGELISACAGKGWKSSSIHILLNRLLDKEAIVVTGFRRNGNHYSRTFRPGFSKEDYTVQLVMGDTKLDDAVIRSLALACVRNEAVSDETLSVLETALKDARAARNAR